MAEQKIFEASQEAKAKASQLRMFAFIAWIVAIGGEVFAILKLIHNNTLTWLIVAIVAILILSVIGSTLWKQANHIDPPSEKDKAKFFLQSQLGAIMGALSFLPLVILILVNKNIDGKTKGIAGAVAGIAAVIALAAGIDFNPASIEKYTNEINQQDSVLHQLVPGAETVYWIGSSGKEKDAKHKYHIYQDCQYLRGKTVQSGTIKQTFDNNGESELCKVCENRARKGQNGTNNNGSNEIINDIKKAADSLIKK
ncbi:MAG: hypothetical protein EKK37_07605 [Sphingobacteriales bacterium]|nr:MAG: hypothetical protein EKK37_07605 [Sphingobacteriales bacterium]